MKNITGNDNGLTPAHATVIRADRTHLDLDEASAEAAEGHDHAAARLHQRLTSVAVPRRLRRAPAQAAVARRTHHHGGISPRCTVHVELGVAGAEEGAPWGV